MHSDRLWILLARKKSGEATPAELEELKDLLATNASEGFSNEILDKVWEAPIRLVPGQEVPPDLWAKIEAKTGAHDGRRRFLFGRKSWLAAASMILVLGSALLLAELRSGWVAGPKPAGQTDLNQVSTQAGSKSKLELPDGTQVWLNGNSRLTYSNTVFGKENRAVELIGEAFFDVAKNEKVPFIIHTGPVNITVMGTAFNVKAYPKEKTIETALVRGLVEITMNQDPERKILLRPNEKIIIPVAGIRNTKPAALPGDSAGAALYSITKWKATDKDTEETAWVNSQLVFDNEPFLALAPKMEGWYHIKIQFSSEEIKNKRFSGVIENESLTETLDAMKISYPFTYQLKGNVLWIGDK